VLLFGLTLPMAMDAVHDYFALNGFRR